jgi:hypothetical protein
MGQRYHIELIKKGIDCKILPYNGKNVDRFGHAIMRGPSALAGLAVAICCSCGDPSGPRPGLNLVQGGGGSDTVGTRLHPPLTVQLLDSHRNPVPGATVYFGTGGPVLVSALDDPGFLTDRLPVITNAAGQAAAWVQFKTSAGPGNVVVSANGQELRLNYQVLPGAPAHVRADPIDTAIYVGSTAKFRPFITDAYGDRRTDTPSYQYQSLNSVLSITASNQARGAAIGRGLVAISALGFTDTVRVSVVPVGRIVAQAFSAFDLVAINLDGSSIDSIAAPSPRSMDWSPVNHRFAMDVDGPEYLLEMDTLGHTHRVVSNSLMRSEFYPRYSPDGLYIYFTGNDSLSTCYGVWRIHPDGTALEQVIADTVDCGPYSYISGPSPSYATSLSPDGSQLVYTGRTLRIRTLATGVDTSLGVVGDVPRWSPTGNWIAYDSLGMLMLIHPDGTGHQVLVDRRDDQYPSNLFTWSPDGQWLLYHTSDRLVIVQVATGLQLPLATTISLLDPTWQR